MTNNFPASTRETDSPVTTPPATKAHPKARRSLTETTEIQDRLTQIFHLDHYAPKR